MYCTLWMCIPGYYCLYLSIFHPCFAIKLSDCKNNGKLKFNYTNYFFCKILWKHSIKPQSNWMSKIRILSAFSTLSENILGCFVQVRMLASLEMLNCLLLVLSKCFRFHLVEYTLILYNINQVSLFFIDVGSYTYNKLFLLLTMQFIGLPL